MQNRLSSNRTILALLSALAEARPDWRFHQLLQNAGVSRPGEDQFYEESEKTLAGMDARIAAAGVSLPGEQARVAPAQ